MQSIFIEKSNYPHFCISRWLATPINPDKLNSTVLYIHYCPRLTKTAFNLAESINAPVTFHWPSFVTCSVQNHPKVEFIHSSKPLWTRQKIFTRTHKTQLHFKPVYFNWNISVTDGIACRLDIPQHRLEGKGCSRGLTTVVTAEPGLRGLDCVWKVMAHAQKPDLVFRRNRRVHLIRRGRQFSRLLADVLCASACRVCTARASLCSAVMWRLLVTHSIRQFPLHFSSRASSCAITFQLDSTKLRTIT